jgi:hypothetical protein
MREWAWQHHHLRPSAMSKTLTPVALLTCIQLAL